MAVYGEIKSSNMEPYGNTFGTRSFNMEVYGEITTEILLGRVLAFSGMGFFVRDFCGSCPISLRRTAPRYSMVIRGQV
jgi:hypothetical protein